MKTLSLILASLLMTACVYTQNSYQDKSEHIDRQKMVQIEVGKTDKQWVLNNLGTPDKIQSTSDGMETYEYINKSVMKSERVFIFLFSIKSEKVNSKHVLSIHFKNNLVDSIGTREE